MRWWWHLHTGPSDTLRTCIMQRRKKNRAGKKEQKKEEQQRRDRDKVKKQVQINWVLLSDKKCTDNKQSKLGQNHKIIKGEQMESQYRAGGKSHITNSSIWTNTPLCSVCRIGQYNIVFIMIWFIWNHLKLFFWLTFYRGCTEGLSYIYFTLGPT